jgi:hypothetical protein
MKNSIFFLFFGIFGCSNKDELKTEIIKKNNFIIFEVTNNSNTNYFLTLGSFLIISKKTVTTNNNLNKKIINANDLEYVELVKIVGEQNLSIKKELLNNYIACEVQEDFESSLEFYKKLGIEKLVNNKFLLSPSNSTVKYIYLVKNLKKNIEYNIIYKNLEFHKDGIIGNKRKKALDCFYGTEIVNGFYSYKKRLVVKGLTICIE